MGLPSVLKYKELKKVMYKHKTQIEELFDENMKIINENKELNTEIINL